MSNIDRLAYNRQGLLFGGCNNAATNFVAVTSIMTGLALYNPPGSGKLLALVDMTFNWTTAPAAVHNVGIALAPASAVALTTATATTATGGTQVLNGFGNAGASVGKLYSAYTGPTVCVAVRWPGGCVYGSGVGESPYSIVDNIDGAICLVPGSAALICALTTTLAGVGSFSWIEVPL